MRPSPDSDPGQGSPYLALLRSEGAMLDRLFHALGGSLGWFRGQVIPHVLAWESWVCGLAAPTCLPDLHRTALTAALEAACVAAERHGNARQRLHWACDAALCAVWLRLQSVRVFDAQGQLWDPTKVTLRSWRGTHPAPHRIVELAAAECRDPWPEVARRLVERGVWHGRSALGRCLQREGVWALLWPLAGRDLIATNLEMHGRSIDASGLLEAMHWFGHLTGPLDQADHTRSQIGHGSPHTCQWPRDDGRVFCVLPVNPAFLISCGVLAPGSHGCKAAERT